MTHLLHQTNKNSQNEFSNTWRDKIVQVILKKVWVVDQWPWLGMNPTIMQKFFERKEEKKLIDPISSTRANSTCIFITHLTS
jgi:hypothetical protein